MPIKTNSFTYSNSFNFSRVRNKVLELAPGVTQITLGGFVTPSTRLIAGEPYGVIFGSVFERERVNEKGRPEGRAARPELVELVLDQLLGPESRDGGLDAVLLRYERLVGAGRRPYLAPLMRELRGELDALLAEILRRSGHPLDPTPLRDLVSLVDGAVISALIEADPDPRAAAREVLLRSL